VSEFDVNKSMYHMPRLYEHINRVDLWVMAQRQQHSVNAATIEKLEDALRRINQSLDEFDLDGMSLDAIRAFNVIKDIIYCNLQQDDEAST
jgi:DNA recombination-dependent growth factor C